MSEAGVERRLTTILAADVVGYSRLMAADEAGTLASLKALRRELIEPKTADYRGRVVKLMGDGTLMEFGSVVDAVNFAVQVQREMARRNSGDYFANAIAEKITTELSRFGELFVISRNSTFAYKGMHTRTVSISFAWTASRKVPISRLAVWPPS